MTDRELLDQAFERGAEAGRIEARVSGLEGDARQTAVTLVSLAALINSTVTTVQLLAGEIKARTEADQQLRESDKAAREETARAIEKEKDNAAKAIREEKELTATTLSNSANKVNIKWGPRSGWANMAAVVALFLGAYITYYITYHR